MEIRTVDRNPKVGRSTGGQSRVSGQRGKPQAASFARTLVEAQEAASVKFSRHAESRMRSWGHELGQERMARLEGAVDAALAKGSRTALVVMKDVAFVVAPQTRTVVTVVPEERIRDNVFTSIDSAVIVNN